MQSIISNEEVSTMESYQGLPFVCKNDPSNNLMLKLDIQDFINSYLDLHNQKSIETSFQSKIENNKNSLKVSSSIDITTSLPTLSISKIKKQKKEKVPKQKSMEFKFPLFKFINVNPTPSSIKINSNKKKIMTTSVISSVILK